MHYLRCFRNINLFNSHDNPRNKFCYYLHILEEETEAQKLDQGHMAVWLQSTCLQLLCSAELSEYGNLLEEGLEEGEIKYNQEANGTISQNLNLKVCWV